MAAIFLSYAREDRGSAQKLAQVLERAGHSVWWDRRLDSGEEFSAEIEAALERSDVVLVAWSAQSVKSRWVRDEAAVGGDTGKLVPVSIDGTSPPMGFRQFHSMNLSGWKGSKRDERTTELLRSVERRYSAPKAKRVTPVPRVRAHALSSFNKKWAAAGAVVLAVLVGAALWLWTTGAGRSGRSEKPTIGLLRLTTSSPDPRLGGLATETLDSISARLAQSGFAVKLFTAPQASAAGTDYIITGDFSSDGGKVSGTLHLNQAAQGVTVSTYRFEAAGDDVHNLPERIGVQMAGNLSAPELAVDRRHPADPTLLAELISANPGANDWLQAYQSMQRIVAKAPDFRYAQVGLAYFTAFSLDQFPADLRAAAIAAARNAYDKGRELDPYNGDVEGAWCYLHSETMLRECEDHLRAGISRSPDDSWLNEFLAAMLSTVGRFDEAVQLQQLSYTHDPYAPNKIAHMLRMLEFTGNGDGAQQLYRDGTRWWPERKPSFVRGRLLGLLERGDFHAIDRLAKQPELKDFPALQISTPIIAALNSKSDTALRRACAVALTVDADQAPTFLKPECLVAFNILGDANGAYALANKMYPRRVGRTPTETEQIWMKEPDGGGPTELLTSPPAATMRREARFVELARRTGLLDYWRSGQLPDFCKPPHHEPVCAQLMKRG